MVIVAVYWVPFTFYRGWPTNVGRLCPHGPKGSYKGGTTPRRGGAGRVGAAPGVKLKVPPRNMAAAMPFMIG